MLTSLFQFNLVCDQKYVRAHFNMIAMIGALVGAPLSGFMCDWYGTVKSCLTFEDSWEGDGARCRLSLYAGLMGCRAVNRHNA